MTLMPREYTLDSFHGIDLCYRPCTGKPCTTTGTRNPSMGWPLWHSPHGPHDTSAGRHGLKLIGFHLRGAHPLTTRDQNPTTLPLRDSFHGIPSMAWTPWEFYVGVPHWRPLQRSTIASHAVVTAALPTTITANHCA